MLTKSRTTLAAALAVAAIGAGPAQAMPIDARGEHAASLSQTTGGVASDQRTADAREPFVRPVVVEVGAPDSGGVDWTSAIAGLAGGLAFAILAGIGVSGARRHVRPSVS